MLSRPVTGLSIAVTIQTWSAGLLAVADRLTAASIPGESGVFVSPSCQPSHQASPDSLKLSVVLVVNRFVPPSLGGGQLSNRGGKLFPASQTAPPRSRDSHHTSSLLGHKEVYAWKVFVIGALMPLLNIMPAHIYHKE